jgi:CheY-like chemotaxis protein
VTQPAPASPAPARTILFVEDEDVLRDAVSRLLRKQNATVIEVADGPDVRVILSSAYAREAVMLSVADRRICDFIRKPYRFEELLKLLGQDR